MKLYLVFWVFDGLVFVGNSISGNYTWSIVVTSLLILWYVIDLVVGD